jgi:GNAT superfamily N-acetyltransferase
MKIELQCPLYDSYRVRQVSGMFDVPIADRLSTIIEVEEPPIDDGTWQIGCIVGLSGSGKSSIARRCYGDALYAGDAWKDCAVIDNFDDADIKDIVGTLTAVGFSSPPSWIKPYSVLSNGEKFRCDLARALLKGGLVVYDEFSSVVDRTVAKIGSAAIAKAIKNKKIDCRFIAVSCHSDIIEWLTPDWTLDVNTGVVDWRLLRRPDIELKIYKCHYSDWRLFAKHHYLDSKKLSTSSQCYVALFEGMPVSFCSVMANVGHKGRRRISRIVTLPDYQGVGIGKQLLNFVADRYKQQGLRVSIGTSHPAMVQSLRSDGRWILTSIGDSHQNKGSTGKTMGLRRSIVIGRRVACFEFVGCP